MVSPYSFDVPGGVQLHVRDLSEHLLAQGHEVSVLAPADEDTALPAYVVAAGRAVPVRYNGSVARLAFGPVTAARVGRWIDKGDFDVVHIHEPVSPSVSLLALWAVDGPTVATFHTSRLRSRAMQTFQPVLRPSLEKIAGRIAVSEDARRTVTTHMGGDAVVIPNGVYVDRFATAAPRLEWQGAPGRPTLAFLGRMEEPRKGMPVLGAALPAILDRIPGTRVLLAGPGDAGDVTAGMASPVAEACEFLGTVSDQDKARLLRSADLYIAPNTGGESFGIILVEAMSAGATVLASDLPPFLRVLDGGRAGATFVNGDPADLARVALELLADPVRRDRLSQLGHARARTFDWSVVGRDVLAVYETVVTGAPHPPRVDPSTRWTRLLRGGRTGAGL